MSNEYHIVCKTYQQDNHTSVPHLFFEKMEAIKYAEEQLLMCPSVIDINIYSFSKEAEIIAMWYGTTETKKMELYYTDEPE